jgi:hypothetical protein
MKQNTPIFTQDGQVIGHVHADRLELRRKGSKHMLRRPAGWAVDVAALDQAELAGARYVLVTDTESGRRYLSSLGTLRDRGLRLERGFGAQVALTLDDWRDPDQAQQPALF